jgi:UDP-glucose 4-epimerase
MVIVIGGSSFIGVYTVEVLLKAGYSVIATGRNAKFRAYFKSMGVDYVHLDVSNKEDFKKLPTEDIEGVILLAALLPANSTADLEKNENAADYFIANTIGTINALEYCRVNGIKRLISTTSYADVFNYWDEKVKITEETPRGFQYKGDHSVYIISKNAASDVIEYYNQQYSMKNAVFRFPPVYGVGPHGSLLVNGNLIKSGLQIFMDKAEAGKDIEVYGDKNVARDVVYVKDVANAFVKAIGSDKTYGLYNIGSGKSTTLDEQANIISDIFSDEANKSSIVYKPEVENKSISYSFDISKARKDFGYNPVYADFKTMMLDWKKEIKRGVYTKLFD